jgi:hypothetical protein
MPDDHACARTAHLRLDGGSLKAQTARLWLGQLACGSLVTWQLACRLARGSPASLFEKLTSSWSWSPCWRAGHEDVDHPVCACVTHASIYAYTQKPRLIRWWFLASCSARCFLVWLIWSWSSGTRSQVACRVRVVGVISARHGEVGVMVPAHILFFCKRRDLWSLLCKCTYVSYMHDELAHWYAFDQLSLGPAIGRISFGVLYKRYGDCLHSPLVI